MAWKAAFGRHGGSLPPAGNHWHGVIKDPTVADAVFDRLVHKAHRIAPHGRIHAQSRPGLLTLQSGSDITDPPALDLFALDWNHRSPWSRIRVRLGPESAFDFVRIRINATRGAKKYGHHHLNNVNAYHSRLKRWINLAV